MKTYISTKASKNQPTTGKAKRNFTRITLVLTLLLLLVGKSWGQTTISTETMGSGGSNGATIAVWETNNYFDNDGYTMSGTGDMRNTSVSSGYTGASGTWNVMLNAANEYFQIAEINTTGYSGLSLSFGIRKNSNAETGSTMSVEVSSDGSTWTTLTMPALPTDQNGWYYRTCTGIIPATSSLYIKFTSSSTTEFRIDDIKLVGTLPSTFTVTYNGNGSTGGLAPTDGSSPYASAATVTVLGNTGSLVKTGYTFAGWNTAANGSGTSYAADATFTISANTTLYAKWTPNNPLLAITANTTNAYGSNCAGTATTKSFTITNSGTDATNVVVSSNNSEYVVSALSTTSILASGTATFDVTYTPTSGSTGATLSAFYNTNTASGTLALTGSTTTAVTPVVTSTAASLVGNTSATLNGGVTTLGVCPSTNEKGFVYSLTATNANPIVGGSGVTKTSVVGITTGAYTLALTGLTSNSGYTFKSYLFDGTTYTYGATTTFTTLAVASKLIFSVAPPATGNVGANLTSFTVQAQRADNSVDAEYTGNIVISKTSGSGAISGTLTVAAVAGVASFSDIQFAAADTYTVTASSGALTPVTSGGIVISAAPLVIAAWDFTGVGSTNLPTYAATTFNSNLVSTSSANNITRGADAAWSGASDCFRTTGFQSNGISTSNTDYLQITLAPSVGYTMSLATIDAKFDGTTTFKASPGVTSQFAYSTDGTTFTLIGSAVQSTSLTMEQINLSGVSALQNIASGTTVTLRYYASGQTTTGGWGFKSAATAGTNGLAIGGVLTASGPTITANPTSLTDFNYVVGNGPSVNKTFTLSGANLTGTGNITVAPSTNYEVSTDGTTWSGSSITYPFASGIITGGTKTVYVRLKAGLAVGTYNSENITISGGGATTVNVACSGTVTATAVAGACATDLIISEYIEGSSNNKAIEIYNATGTSIDLSVYSLKKQGNGVGAFGDELTLSGTLNDATAYVIVNNSAGATLLAKADMTSNSSCMTFNGNDAVGLFKNGTQIDEVGVENQVADWGKDITLVRKSTIVAGNTTYSASEWDSYSTDEFGYLKAHTMICGPTIALTPATLSDFNYIYGSGPSAEKTFTVSGTNLTANISITPPTNYEISTTTGGSFSATNPITLTQSGGNVASTTIYVRLKAGLAVGSYNSETITASSTDATNKIVTCSGIVTACTTSTLSASATLTEPATNSSIADTPAELFSVFDFTFTDDNGSGGDNIATKISQIVVKQGTGNVVADWTKVIAYAKLVDNNNKEQIGTVNTTDITFSSIPNNTGTPYDLGYIADNADKTYTLKIYFKTDFGSEKTTIDGKNLVYLVDNSCFVFADPSSNLAAAQSVNSGATNNEISVIASKLLFSTNKPPATSITNTNTNVEVTATDENGNRDLGSVASITLSKVTGSGTVSSVAGLTKLLSSGIYSWTDVRFSSAGIYTITANDGGSLTDITSGNILITDAPTVIWSDNCNPQHTWDVDNGSANWVNISPTSNPPAYSGNCYKTAAANTLYANSKEYILTSEVISLADYSNCQLSFWMWMESESTWDGGIVEVNSTSLGAWTKFNGDIAYDGNVSGLSTTAWYGAKTTWQKITIDLSTLDGQTNLQFRFRFKTDVSTNKYGWAVDEMQVTGAFSGCAGPSVQASNLSMTNIAGTTMDLNYTRGDGTGGVLVVARQGSAVNADPVSGISYSSGNFGAGSQIGTGNWVVYNGSANSCTVAGLTSSTNYHFAIYEYNTVGTCYNKNELIGNATTICLTAVDVTAATATPASTIVYIGWTNPICYDEVMIIAKPSASITGTPSGDGSAYSAILNYGGAGTAFDGGKVVYKGSVSPQVVYGLTNGTLYYFKIFTRKGTTWSSGVEVSATPIAGTLAANGSGTATMTNGAIGNINGLDIWQRNKSSQIANFVITGVSGGWLQNIQIDLSTFSTNLLASNVAISGNAQYGATTIIRTGQTILINNLNLTNTNTLIVSISGLSTIDIIADTDLGNKTINVQTGNTAGSRSAIASSPVAYLTVPFANAKKYTDNGTTAILNYKGQTVAVEGISTIASGRLSTSEYDQFFIQEGDGSGAKGLCVRKGSAFSPGAQIAHFYIVKGPLDLISGGVTGQTDAYKNMTAINTPTHIVDLGAATLPTPYFVEIEALYAMSYSEFEEVDGLLMRIPSVKKASGTWPALGSSSGNVRMKDFEATNNLRCYIFGNTDVGGDEPTWPTNMATLVYNFDQYDNYKGRQITPVYKMNFFDEIIWNGSTGNGRWSDALNWSPNILPQQSDEVLFDNITGDANSYTVVYDVLTMQTIKSLRINPTSPNTITLNFPNTCTFSPAITINLSGDAVIIENGGVINADFGATTGDPLTLAASGTGGKLIINNGGRFIWKADQSNAYILDRLSTVAGTEKGIFEFDIQSSASEPISFSDRTYGSLVLSASDGSNTYQIQGANNTTIRGDFIVNNNVTIDENWGTKYSGTINIGGNFTNNASAWNINSTINTPSNLILLNGTASQIISSSSTTMNIAGSGFGKNIQISNTSGGVSLASDIKLNKNLTMTSGILNTGSYVVDLSTTGTLIETPINPTSYITGNVRATRDIGTGAQSFGGLGLTLTENSGANSTVVTRTTGATLQGNSDCCASNSSIKRYFDIQPTTNTGLNSTMDFSYFDHELNGLSESSLIFFKAALPYAGSAANPWTAQAGTVEASSNTANKSGITGFSRWTLASLGSPLPVELISFNAVCNHGNVEINWSTASETNNSHFVIERNNNGKSWNKIGQVAGAGNSSTTINYKFTDITTDDNTYYRITQVDFDGQSTSYDPIAVNCNNETETNIEVFPNPFNDQLTLKIGNSDEVYLVSLQDASGKIVLETQNITSGVFELNTSNLAPGVYVLKVSGEKTNQVVKVVKR